MGTSFERGNFTFRSNISFCATTDKHVIITIYLYDLTANGNLQFWKAVLMYHSKVKKFPLEYLNLKNLLRLSNLSLCAAPVLVSLGNLWLSALSQSWRGPLRNNSPKKLFSQISPLVPSRRLKPEILFFFSD